MSDGLSRRELEGLLGRRVRHHGITLGHVADVLLGQNDAVVGVAMMTIGDEQAFVPWPSVELADGELLVPSPLAVLSEAELHYYRRVTRSLLGTLPAGAARAR